MKVPVTVTTFDADTGATIATKATHAHLVLKPVPLGTCEECGRRHAPEAPHDAESLRYQYRFYAEHTRWPSWADAMAHCPDPVRMVWTDKLALRGIDVHGGRG